MHSIKNKEKIQPIVDKFKLDEDKKVIIKGGKDDDLKLLKNPVKT